MEIKTRNVNTAFKTLVQLFHSHNTPGPYTDDWGHKQTQVIKRPSRNGTVLMINEPVLITYTHPRERVLFNAARDANPFFHLYESLWMLAGRNDVAPVAYYAGQMAEYSDDGRTLNGAYGWRWRHAKGRDYGSGPTVVMVDDPTVPCGKRAVHADLSVGDLDQLGILVAHLKADPTSRRAVLQMWNVEDDLLKIGVGRTWEHEKSDGSTFRRDANGTAVSKDVCCNLSVLFSLRAVESERVGFDNGGYRNVTYLDMTVTNRSNDLVWGLLGANYVHFTVLQEYLAARLGAEVGRYHHFTNDLHVYTETNSGFKPDEWLNEHEEMYDRYRSIEDGSELKLVPLVRDPEAFEREVPEFVEFFLGKLTEGDKQRKWKEPFLETVAKPALTAFFCHKQKTGQGALMVASAIESDDWRLACTQWLKRRADRVRG